MVVKQHMNIKKKILTKSIVSIILTLIVFNCFGQKTKTRKWEIDLKNEVGVYETSKGLYKISLNKDSTFYYFKSHKMQTHPVVLECDTLAKGLWKWHKGFITLKSRDKFNHIDFNVIETKKRSTDSLYFKIVLPVESDLEYNNFNFFISTYPVTNYFDSDLPEFSIPKKNKPLSYNLTIRRKSLNSFSNSKCNQRVSFVVFEDYKPQNDSINSFTIYLNNFNNCFYNEIVIDKDIIGVENGRLFWDGAIFYKVDNRSNLLGEKPFK
jgi:hypothetical protein